MKELGELVYSECVQYLCVIHLIYIYIYININIVKTKKKKCNNSGESNTLSMN